MRRIPVTVLALVLASCLPASVAAASPPTIEYFAPSPLRNHDATARYSVDPEGLQTSYELKYGPASGDYLPHTYPWEGELPAGSSPVMLKAELPAHFQGELTPGHTYYWRVIAKNADGTTEGPEQQFTTTDQPAPEFTTGAVTVQSPTSVIFEGTVDPQGNPLTGCRFRWVNDETHTYAGFERSYGGPPHRFGETVPCAESSGEIGSGTGPVSVHAEATITTPGVYWVRLEGENAYEGAVAPGIGVEFETLAPLLVICGSGGCQSTSAPLTETIPTSGPSAAQPAGLPPRLAKKQGKKPLKKKRRQLRRNATIVAPR